MSQADDIRQFVREKYIQPAKAGGGKDVVVRAGDVHRALGLSNALPAICSAIGSDKFLSEAGVSIVAREGPLNSTTTTFTFAINKDDGEFSASYVEAELRRRYGSSQVDTKYLVSFALPDGRELALQRDSAAVQLWLEDSGLPIPNAEQRLYGAGDGRHSNLPNRLRHQPVAAFREQGFPRPVRSVRIASTEQLSAVLDWYERSAAQDRITNNDGVRANLLEVKLATNLILYGPPGTGKTYATAWEAVRLCIGDAAAAQLRSDRDALMTEYRRLASEGQIEFVTFHQSFSYEDFVEGLRPTTETELMEDGQGSTVASGGFSLKVHAGVFKVISERARLDTGNAVAKRLDRSRSIYKIALGQRGSQEDRIREGLDKSLIHIGWGGDIDWSDDRFDDFDEIRKEWKAKKDQDASGKDPNIEMTFAFRSGLQVGDYVIISDGRDSYRAFGKVTGEYEFDRTASFHPHRRKVEWVWRSDEGAERKAFYPKNFRRQSAYRLDPNLVDWDALETVVIDPNAERPVAGARPHVLIIDEINRANISKVFGELITLLEVDKRLGCKNELRVRLTYSGTSFGVPSNLHIIGTMNTADRSIALLDTALRRRFTFRELMPDTAELRNAMESVKVDADNLDGVNLSKLLSTINERIEYFFDREHQIGHAYFTGCRSRADIEDVMRHKVIPLLAEYFYEDWSKVAAVLGDGSGAAKAHFLEAKKLSPPAGLADDELGGEKLRWSVKAEFDFSEFAV